MYSERRYWLFNVVLASFHAGYRLANSGFIAALVGFLTHMAVAWLLKRIWK